MIWKCESNQQVQTVQKKTGSLFDWIFFFFLRILRGKKIIKFCFEKNKMEERVRTYLFVALILFRTIKFIKISSIYWLSFKRSVVSSLIFLIWGRWTADGRLSPVDLCFRSQAVWRHNELNPADQSKFN